MKFVAVLLNDDQLSAGGGDQTKCDREVGFWASCDGTHVNEVSPAGLASFLVEHDDHMLVCLAAAKLFWTFDDWLRDSDDGPARQMLHCRVRRAALLDLNLLAQRKSMLFDGKHDNPQSLDDICSEYLNRRLPTNPTPMDKLAAMTALVAATGAHVHQVSSRGIALFGPFDVGYDIMGSIALELPDKRWGSRNIRFVPDLIAQVETRLEQASHTLYRHSKWRDCFQWDESNATKNRKSKRLSVGSDEELCADERKLRNELKVFWEHLAYSDGGMVTPPYNANKELSLIPEHWGLWGKCHRQFSAWWSVTESLAAIQDIRNAASKKLSVKYDIIPEIRAVRGRLTSFLLNDGRYGIDPLPGKQLVVVELDELMVRCICWIARLQRGQAITSQLRKAFAWGKAMWIPLAELVSKVEVLDIGSNETSGLSERTVELEYDGDLYDGYSKIVRGLLIGLLHGFSDSYLAVFLSETIGEEISSTELKALKDEMIKPAGDEPEEFVSLDIFAHMTDRLEIPRGMIIDLTLTCLEVREPNKQYDTIAQFIRHAIHAREAHEVDPRIKELFGRLIAANPSTVLELERPDSILVTSVSQARGRTARPVYYWEVPQQECNYLADVIRKRVAFEFATLDFGLLGIAGDKFLVEVPAGTSLRHISDCAEAAVRDVVGSRFARHWVRSTALPTIQ